MIWFFIIYFFQKYVLFLLSKNAALVFLRKKNIAEVATDKIIIRLHWGFVRSVDVIFLRKHTVSSQNFLFLAIFLVILLVKNCTTKFFLRNCNIHFQTFVIWQFFSNLVLIIDFFYGFNSNILLEAGQILERSQ